jgi:hypothetical protein
MIDRRAVMAGLAAGLAAPAHAAPDTRRGDLDAALDAGLRDPAAGLRALARFDADALAPAARLDLVTARAGLAIDAQIARRFPAGRPGRSPYRVTPRTGAWQSARRDAAAIDRDSALLAADRRAGVILPRSAIDRTLAALDDAAAHASPPVAAALARQHATLATMRGVAPELPGLSRLRDGAALYTMYLRRSCGSDVEPVAALARLQRERDVLLARADRLFARIGLCGGAIGTRFSALWHDPRWLYPDSDAGRVQAVADMNRQIADARSRIRATFGDTPIFAGQASVRALSPEDVAAGKQGFREAPAPDHPGVYVVDLADIRRRPAWTLPSVVAHELLPGHLLQLGIEGQAPPHPLRTEYAAAFVEGWGIHAETLAPYRDTRAALGHLHWLLFRVGRAIVDLGIHLRGWTVAQARGALVAWQGEPAYFAPFDMELDRIALEPGSRAGEALAWLAIADALRGTAGATRIARHRAILFDGRKRTETIAAIARNTP